MPLDKVIRENAWEAVAKEVGADNRIAISLRRPCKGILWNTPVLKLCLTRKSSVDHNLFVLPLKYCSYLEMPGNMTWPKYILFATTSILTMIAGSQCVHRIYNPLSDLEEYVERERQRVGLKKSDDM